MNLRLRVCNSTEQRQRPKMSSKWTQTTGTIDQRTSTPTSTDSTLSRTHSTNIVRTICWFFMDFWTGFRSCCAEVLELDFGVNSSSFHGCLVAEFQLGLGRFFRLFLKLFWGVFLARFEVILSRFSGYFGSVWSWILGRFWGWFGCSLMLVFWQFFNSFLELFWGHF